MKNALFSVLLLMTFSLKAAETFLPENMECISDAKRMEFQQFQLTKFNSGKPLLSTGISWARTDFAGENLILTYLDQDQQQISLIFSKQLLYLLKLGSVTNIDALLDGPEESVTINCTELKKL